MIKPTNIMNDGANFVRYEIGMNVIPADTKNKKPIVEWKLFEKDDVTDELHQEWIDQHKFESGMAVFCGEVRHNKEKKGYYLNAIDLDNESAITEFCKIKGVQHTLEELAEGGDVIVEQHADDKTRAHVYVWSKEPFKKKAATPIDDPNVPRIEVKGRREDGLMFISPSVHKNGHRYQFMGKYLQAIREPILHDEIVKHINEILKKYGITYLNGGAAKSSTLISVKNNEKIQEGARHDFLLSYAASTLRRLYDTTQPDIIKKIIQEVNVQRCEPPLEVKEVDQIWDSALQFISEQVLNENVMGKGKGKDQKVRTKKRIPIKKYSQNGLGSLYESVIIGSISKFVYLDKNKNPQFVDKIDRSNDVLEPADTIDTQNPIPFVFDSENDFHKYFEDAKNLNLEILFKIFESINRKYVDIEDYYHVLLTADMIWTWLQDRFSSTPYNIFTGDNGSGKNSQLLVFRFLGYRVYYVVSASAANYYTKMGNIEEGQITVAEDEVGDIARDREKRNVFASGYCSGGSVPKVELEGGRKSEDWLTYAQKWITMEELQTTHPDMKGVLDRSFVFRFVAGNPQHNIKDVIKSAGDPKFQPLHDELARTRKLMFCWRLLHYDDVILDVKINLKNRSAELTKPLIRLFQNSPIALERILDSLSKFILEKNDIKKNSFESKLYKVIKFLKDERKQRLDSKIATDDEKALGELTFTNFALMNMTKEIMECVETEKVGLYWSSLLGCTISQTKITSVAKSKFKAVSVSVNLHDEYDARKTFRCLKFEEKYLNRIELSYDIPERIEILKDSNL